MTEAYPMATLYRALHAARKATKALIRDDIAPATDRRGPFTYPSQESVQEAWYTAEAEFGLLLLDQGQEQEDTNVLFAWILVHVESGVSMPLDLCWPMFASDDLDEAHARAACWSHAWRHLVCHLLGIRIAAPAAQNGPAGAQACGRSGRLAGACRHRSRWRLGHAHHDSEHGPPTTV